MGTQGGDMVDMVGDIGGRYEPASGMSSILDILGHDFRCMMI